MINNRTEVVVTNEVRFDRKSKDMRRSRTTKAISMLQTMYSKATDAWETYQDPYFGLYILRRSDIPVSDCEMARTQQTFI